MNIIMAIVFSLFFMNSSIAALYETKDAKGNVIYSDTPSGPQSQLILPPKTGEYTSRKLDKLESTTMQNPPTDLDSSSTDNDTPPLQYKKFDILSPANEESIQNQPMLNVSVLIDPPLQKGHSIQLFLDGSPWGDAYPSTHFSYTIPYRGTHSLSAKLYNDKHQVIKETARIIIYVHQAHINRG